MGRESRKRKGGEEGEGEERWGREKKKAYTFLNIAERMGGDA